MDSEFHFKIGKILLRKNSSILIAVEEHGNGLFKTETKHVCCLQFDIIIVYIFNLDAIYIVYHNYKRRNNQLNSKTRKVKAITK